MFFIDVYLYVSVFLDAGDSNLFLGLEASLIEGLPRDPSEWRRSYGRASKSVYVESKFEAFSEDKLSKESENKLIGTPILHVFWTDCVVCICDVILLILKISFPVI
jgi:hypothetical protein